MQKDRIRNIRVGCAFSRDYPSGTFALSPSLPPTCMLRLLWGCFPRVLLCKKEKCVVFGLPSMGLFLRGLVWSSNIEELSRFLAIYASYKEKCIFVTIHGHANNHVMTQMTSQFTNGFSCNKHHHFTIQSEILNAWLHGYPNLTNVLDKTIESHNFSQCLLWYHL